MMTTRRWRRRRNGREVAQDRGCRDGRIQSQPKADEEAKKVAQAKAAFYFIVPATRPYISGVLASALPASAPDWMELAS